ncbi:MAG TPA: ABC transporter substrate-binding protein, partial [Candidatus Paceibacterota bacterium]|nr:ABC transporter substrate-binding protein [Candidatus Paceibacterota bacterium]
MKPSLLISAVVVGTALFLAGPARGAADSGPVKIGAIFSVTGPAAFLGAPEAKTARMLIDQINAAGGVNGRKLELVLKDSGGSPEKAVSFAK